MQKVYYVDTNKKSDFCELWQRHEQLKSMEMNEVWPDIYDEGYVNVNFNSDPLTKFNASSRSSELTISCGTFSNDLRKCLNQYENSHKLCDKKGSPLRVLPFWVYRKVSGNRDNIRIFQCLKSHWWTNTRVWRKKEIQKSETVQNTCPYCYHSYNCG